MGEVPQMEEKEKQPRVAARVRELPALARQKRY